MNVIEKILEEIKQYTKDVYECDLDDIVEYQRRNREDKCTYIVQGIEEATEFIRSHMDELGCDERLVKKFVTNREVIRDFNDKPIYIKGCCPNCGCELKACETDYCRVCGQALDWNNPKEGL